MPTHTRLNELGFCPAVSMGTAAWEDVPDEPGVYVILDRAEVIYVGMAGRNGNGSLRQRLRSHANGSLVNMFAQYLLFNRILDPADLPRSPQVAGQLCREYISKHCMARVRPTNDAAEARIVENCLRKELKTAFNGL